MECEKILNHNGAFPDSSLSTKSGASESLFEGPLPDAAELVEPEPEPKRRLHSRREIIDYLLGQVNNREVEHYLREYDRLTGAQMFTTEVASEAIVRIQKENIIRDNEWNRDRIAALLEPILIEVLRQKSRNTPNPKPETRDAKT